MKLFIGGAGQEVGRSAITLSTDYSNIVLDAGLKILQNKSLEIPTIPKKIGAILLTHSHLDHSGYIPALFNGYSPELFLTLPTLEISEIMWKDTVKIAKLNNQKPIYNIKNIKKALKNSTIVPYNQKYYYKDIAFTYREAGHILGAAFIEMEVENKKIIYTGDFKYKPTRLINQSEKPSEADYLIIESTYWYQNHPNIKDQIEKIYNIVDETIDNRGIALFPAFALGRSQELVDILVERYKDKVPIYLDGMGKSISKIYKKYLKFNSLKYVNAAPDRIEESCIIISSAGMLEGGPVLRHILNLNNRSSIILTGYQLPGSNGYKLLTTGKITIGDKEIAIDLPVHYISLSAHADKEDIQKFIKEVSPSKVILVHSEDTSKYKIELEEKLGIEVLAPKSGEYING